MKHDSKALHTVVPKGNQADIDSILSVARKCMDSRYFHQACIYQWPTYVKLLHQDRCYAIIPGNVATIEATEASVSEEYLGVQVDQAEAFAPCTKCDQIIYWHNVLQAYVSLFAAVYSTFYAPHLHQTC